MGLCRNLVLFSTQSYLYSDIIFFRFKDANFDIINHQDSEGRTALHLAVAQHNEAAVRALLAVGKCQVSVQDNMKRSPLHWAAVLGLLPSHYQEFCARGTLTKVKSATPKFVSRVGHLLTCALCLFTREISQLRF